jgi:hypothetical protein
MKILDWAIVNKIQIQTQFIPGITNKKTYALSRLARSGDYSIPKIKARQIMKKL